MGYPVWELQASGLVIAIVSILHVFVSHFAVGGGLFLVLAEHKARREDDAAFLGYVRRLGRFFILLTLVFGAISGVGIWFTITLVHPAATSSLIGTFVWAWAIEWTFFLTEIAAAMVYYYGWDRLAPRTHLAVGWIYFVAAWLSLVVINSILSFMLTPGAWVATHGFWDGFFNPTYWPSTVARTAGAAGLAGLYAIATASGLNDAALRRKVARWAGLGWVLPMAVALPLALAWYFQAAAGAGIPVGEIMGSRAEGFRAVLAAALSGVAQSGSPFAQRAARVGTVALALSLAVTLYVVLVRRERCGRPEAIVLLVCGLAAIGSAEWLREDLRKPYVIGHYMFVNGVRLPAPESVPSLPAAAGEDPFTVTALGRSGVLAASLWARLPPGSAPGALVPPDVDPETRTGLEAEIGREVFKLQCAACHSIDRYNAIRPLVRRKSSATIAGLLPKLALPVDAAGETAAWNDPELRLATWRNRRMPPFAGNETEARALSVYLAQLGGGKITPPPAPVTSDRSGAQQFEDVCAMCHGPEGDWPFAERVKGRSAAQFYELIGDLPRVNPVMPVYEGSDSERQALAEYLAGLGAPGPGHSAEVRR